MEITAREGMWLTQANLKEDEQRGFWKKMHLAYSLTQDDFTEWTDEQKSAWEEQHKEEDMEE
jgi:hypothetical protein